MNKKIVFILLSVALSFSSIVMCGETLQENQIDLQKRKRGRRIGKKIRSNKIVDPKEAERVAKLIQFNNSTDPLQLSFKKTDTKADQELSLFLTEIEFTHSGIATFFSQSFNRKEYGKEFLPHNFSHLTQFLRYGNQLSQPPEFFEVVIRLFHQKIKSSPFVNAQALEKMLADATIYLEQQFPKEEKLSFWKDIKKLLWTSFKDKFSFLKSDPMAFFEDISDDIIQKVRIHVSSPDKLRSSILRFTESNIDKVVWSPYDQLDTWKSFKNLGTAVTQLHEKNIITDPYNLNDLYWGLVERYCYFLELTGTLLSKQTIIEIHKDIVGKKVAWLQTEEQEEGLETKTERLTQAIIETQAKIQSADYQILPRMKLS